MISKEKEILELYSQYLNNKSYRLPITIGVFGNEVIRNTEIAYNAALMMAILFKNLNLGDVSVVDTLKDESRSNKNFHSLSSFLFEHIPDVNAKNSMRRVFDDYKKEENITQEQINSILWQDDLTPLSFILNKEYLSPIADDIKMTFITELLNSLHMYHSEIIFVILPSKTSLFRYDKYNEDTFYRVKSIYEWLDNTFNILLDVSTVKDESYMNEEIHQIIKMGAKRDLWDSIKSKTIVCNYNKGTSQPYGSDEVDLIRINNKTISDDKSKIFVLKESVLFPMLLDEDFDLKEYQKNLVLLTDKIMQKSILNPKEVF